MPSPYGPSDIELHIDNASAVLTDYSSECLSNLEEMVEALNEDKTPINAEAPVHRSSGFKTMSDYTIQLNYTDATRTAFVGSEGATRSLRIITGSDQMDVEALVVSAKILRSPRNEVGPLELVLKPTGTWSYS